MNSKQEKLERDKLVEKLCEIASGSRRSKTVRLREIFEDIEAAKACGATNKEIVAGLAEINLIFDVNNFKNAVSRIRKERTIQALTLASNRSAKPPQVTTTAANKNKLENEVEAAKVKSKDLKKNAAKPVTLTATETNPLRALSGKPKEVDLYSIPAVKFEVDNS